VGDKVTLAVAVGVVPGVNEATAVAVRNALLPVAGVAVGGFRGGIGVGLIIIGVLVGAGTGVLVGAGIGVLVGTGIGVLVGTGIGVGVGGIGVGVGEVGVSIAIWLVAFACERIVTTPITEKMKSAPQTNANLIILYPFAFSLFFTYFPYVATPARNIHTILAYQTFHWC
jgi:hypothetical protein